MTYLLKLEWLKLKKNSVFQWMVVLYLVLLPLLLLAISSMQIKAPGLSADLFVKFPAIWSILGYAGNWISHFLFGFLAIYMVTSEFANRTFRQNIISGLARSQLYYAKILFLVVLAFIATVYYTVICLLVGYYSTENPDVTLVWSRGDMIARYFLMCLGYMSLGLLLAILIRRTAISVFLYFAYTLFFESIWRWAFHRKIFENISMHFYPANAFEDLAPIPFDDWAMAKEAMENSTVPYYLTPIQATVTSAIYIMLFLIWGHYLVTRKDL